ncbi:MAG: peptidylprolyl isomerase [Planctomycetes bacterium]|nr:peptidylprolyl isomerase [Planctomycetota bacterium]
MKLAAVLCLNLILAASCAAREAAPMDSELREIALAEDARNFGAAASGARSARSDVRARAAKALGRIGNKDAISILQIMAGDRDERVATEALFAWGLLGGTGVAAGGVFDNLQKNPSESVRAAAVEALGRSSDAANVRKISDECLGDASARVRGEAAIAIFRLYQKIGKPPQADEQSAVNDAAVRLARAALREKNDDVRWKQAYALQNLRQADVYPALLTLSKNTNPLARLFAVRALGKRRGDDDNKQSEEFDQAIVRLLRDPDARVAAEAALAITQKNATADMIVNLLVLQNRAEYFVRRAMFKAARNFGDRQIELFNKTAGETSPMARGERAMLRKLSPDEYAKLLNDPEPIVREKAVDAIAELPSGAALPLLKNALEDLNYRVAAAAAAALGKIAEPAAHRLLLRALAHPRGLVRENAAGSLEEHAGRAGWDMELTVRELLKSASTARGDDLAESLSGIISAIEAVEKARRTDGKSKINENDESERELRARIRVVLLDALSDPDVTVRAKAESAWKTLLSAEPIPSILIPAAPSPSIPGVNADPFLRAPKIRIFTNRGSFDAELFHDDAPVHAENMLQLTEAGHYNKTVWHRAEMNFVVQGGDHLGDGTGARAVWGGTLRDEINQKHFVRGTIGMPKSNINDSGGCQIFITHIPTPHLDGRYTAFGQVTTGLEIVDSLEAGDLIDHIEILDSGR